MTLWWYIFLALAVLTVVILSVPSDSAVPIAPMAVIGASP
jgi:hypothetical protein